MNLVPVFLLSVSCATAFGLAVWAYSLGLGLLGALMIYSLSGTATFLLIAVAMYLDFNAVAGRTPGSRQL